MKVLVTGAYGQLGNEIKELTVQYPKWNFIFTDADSLDITNEKTVEFYFEMNQFDFVINCAITTIRSDALLSYEVNYLGSINIARAALALDIP